LALASKLMGWDFAISLTIAAPAPSSVDPSSTTMISSGGSVWEMTLSRASRMNGAPL
jgi:hypothetical protein